MNENNDNLIDKLNKKYSELEKKYHKETEQLKKENEELRMKLMFLEGVANSSIEGFLVVDPFGQIILQNQRTIDLWKIPKDVLEDTDGLKQVEHVKSMTVNPEKFVEEINYQIEHPNEKSRDELELIDGTVLERYSSPVNGPDGVNYGRIYSFHDITERKKIEEQLIQLNADKDRFISILAHDLRNPFQTLLTYSDLLNKEFRDYSVERVEELLGSMNNIVKKTFELLEDTLLWASNQSKIITYNPVESDLSEIINEVIDILEPSTKTKNIEIEYLPDAKTSVKMDVYMIKAVLRNLISNAIKFTKSHGKISVSTSHNKSETIIKVKDNGVGIKKEVMEHLFRHFPANSSRGTANEAGFGLGLLLCKEFVERHGGVIQVESVVDEGTVVSFTLPD